MPLNSAGTPSWEAIQAAIDEATADNGRRGRALVTDLVTGTPVSLAVGFSSPLESDTPVIVTGLGGTTQPQNFDISTANSSSAGFTVYVTRRAGSTPQVTINWAAWNPES